MTSEPKWTAGPPPRFLATFDVWYENRRVIDLTWYDDQWLSDPEGGLWSPQYVLYWRYAPKHPDTVTVDAPKEIET